MDFEEGMASEIYARLTNIDLDFYSKERIKRWRFQFHSTLNDIPDVTKNVNIVTAIQREFIDLPWRKATDVITAHYDINTEIPKQDGKNITKKEKTAFLEGYTKLHEKLSKGIFGDLYE